jgi:hypothetical protein
MNKLSETTSPYFTERYDANGRIGFTPLQKCADVLRQLAYGTTADTMDEYMKLGKTTALKCLEYYCVDIVHCYRAEFLHRPTVVDTQRLLACVHEGFVPLPQQEKHQFFSAKQSTLRKDVECVFGLLKKRFNILDISDQSYSQRTLGLIMRVSIILYIMIIDDE